MYDNSNNHGSGVKRDAGGDEKQLIKFAWPYYVHEGMLLKGSATPKNPVRDFKSLRFLRFQAIMARFQKI